MGSTARKLLEDALALPEPEREALVEALSDSLDPTPVAVSLAWQAEIGKRIADIENGKVSPVAWANAKERIESCLARK